MYCIPIDLHSATFTYAIYNPRKGLMKHSQLKTTEENLIEVVCSAPGPRVVVIEETTLTQWAYGVLVPYADKVVVSDPKANRSISGDIHMDDLRSAIKLGKLYLDGNIKEISHSMGKMAELRAVVLHYDDLNRQIVRFKNKLKAVFRGVAVEATGKLYEPALRPEWLAKLAGHPDAVHRARQLMKVVDVLEQHKAETHQEMVKRGKAMGSLFDRLDTMPGAGPVVAAVYIGLICSADRFSKESKLWHYAGFALKRHESDGKVYENRTSRSGNRVLKWVVNQQFEAAVHRARKSNRFKRLYQRLLDQGTAEADAYRTVCRSLLSTVRALWIKGEAYRDNP
jgi:hypothetical protein